MQTAIEALLNDYEISSVEQFEQALREVIQDIALLGMWRGKFFEHGAFYGGTALRLLYGLDRFSEDLDFTLFQPDSEFKLQFYEDILVRELRSFGFEVEVQVKVKKGDTSVQSAFLRANTLVHLLKISHPAKTHGDKLLKVKLEVDTHPSKGLVTTEKPMVRPIPFTVRTLDTPSLFAGKIAAALFRSYKFNVKGRDWYDFLWHCARNTPINLEYFTAMAQDCGGWPKGKFVQLEDLKELLRHRIQSLDLDKARADVSRFVLNKHVLDGWTKDVFLSCIEKLRV